MKRHALSAAVLLALALIPATILAQDDGTWTAWETFGDRAESTGSYYYR